MASSRYLTLFIFLSYALYVLSGKYTTQMNSCILKLRGEYYMNKLPVMLVNLKLVYTIIYYHYYY